MIISFIIYHLSFDFVDFPHARPAMRASWLSLTRKVRHIVPLLSFIICLLSFSIDVKAQSDSVDISNIRLRDVFISMPDSLLPTLSHNQKLDLIDYMESGLKAEVKNRFEGQSELLSLTADSLSLRVSQGLTVDMLLLPLEEAAIDSCSQVVCVVERFGTSPDCQESRVRLYSIKWRPLDEAPLAPEAQRKLKHLKQVSGHSTMTLQVLEQRLPPLSATSSSNRRSRSKQGNLSLQARDGLHSSKEQESY